MADKFGWFLNDAAPSRNTQSDFSWFLEGQSFPRQEEEEEKGFVLNALAGAGERGAELFSNLVEFTGNVAKSGEDWLAETTGLNPYIEFGEDGISFDWYRDPNETGSMLQPLADGIEELGDFGYEPRFTWENFKGEDGELSWDDWTNPKKLAGFVIEQGVHSAPDMAAAMTTLPAYIASRTQEIAEQREVNKGKRYRFTDGVYIEDPNGPIGVDSDGVVTIGDLAEALPTATAAAALERFGALSIFKSAPGATLKSRIFKGATREGATEFLQENVEYAGEVIGTPVPYDTAEALDRGFAGAIAGSGFGGLLAGGDSLIRGNELPNAVQRGQQESQQQGGDNLDQAASAARSAAQTNVEVGGTSRLRQRMGLEPQPLMDVEDLAGTSAENPIPVVPDSPAQTLSAEETTLDPSSLSREQLEELYPAAYEISPFALGQIGDFRRLGIPNEQTYLAVLASRRADRTAPSAPERTTREPRQPIGQPSRLDPLTQLTDTILLNDADIRAAEAAGDMETADALYEDNVRLRSVEAQLKRANQLASEGNVEAAQRIINRVYPVLQEEAGRRAAFDFTPPQQETLLLEDQGIIYGAAPEDAPQRPARVTRRKTSGEPYPTTKSAQAAMNFLQSNEPEYNWAVIRDGDGFAIEGNLPEGPGATVINEVTPDAVIERAQQSQRQRLQDLRFDEEEIQPAVAMEAERLESQVSIGDIITGYEAAVTAETERLDTMRADYDKLLERDLSGMRNPNPASTIKDTDDLLLTILKLGGINIEDARGNDFDTKNDNPRPYSVGRYRLFKKDGKTFDELRESLQEDGWFQPEDPNQPPQLGANQVMEVIRDAINNANDGVFTYKPNKAADIAALDRDIDLQEEMLTEFEGLLESYVNEINPEEAGLNDRNMYDAAQFFENVTQEVYSGPDQLPAQRAEAVAGDVPALDAGRDSAAERDARGGERRDQEAAEDRSTESVAEERDNLPPDVITDTTTEAGPQGPVFASEAFAAQYSDEARAKLADSEFAPVDFFQRLNDAADDGLSYADADSAMSLLQNEFGLTAPNARRTYIRWAAENNETSPARQPDFELGTYTESDIAALEARDIEAMEAREQIDRERDQFALDSGESSLSAATQRLGQAPAGDMFGFEEVQPRSKKDYGFERKRLQITSKFNQLSESDLDEFLDDIGAQKKGTKQEKIERLVEAFEAKHVFETTGPYESQVQIEQAIKDGVIDKEDAARFASVIATSQNSTPNPIATSPNARAIAIIAARMRAEAAVPYRTEAEQAAFDEERAPVMEAYAQEEAERKARNDKKSEWFRENSQTFVKFWEKATPETRKEMLSLADIDGRALGKTERIQKRRINAPTPSKLANEASVYLIEWATDNFESYLEEYKNKPENWDAVEWARYLDRPQEEIERLIKDREVRDLALQQAEQPSNAPEHRSADTGVSEEQLAELVEILGKYRVAEDTLPDSERITRVLQAPAEKDRVRLKDKVNILTGSQGFLTPEQAEARVQKWRDNARGQFKDPVKRAINDNLVVLSLFDLTGSWSDPWAEAGYEVYTFDIQSNPYVGDITNFGTDFFQDLFNMFSGKEVHAILAACPCTDFASSGSRHFSAKDKDGRTYSSIQLVQATLDAIQYFKPSVWAIENPVGRIEKMNGLPPWSLSFDPYHFGEDYTKKTLLWGRMNADLPIAPTEPTAGSKMHSQYGGSSIETKNARSETPEGFAYAFFDANNAVDHPIMTMQNRYDMVDPDAVREAVEAGMSFYDIDNTVMDPYYMDLDYEAAAEALREAAAEARGEQEEDGESGPVFSVRNQATRKSVNPSALSDKKLDSTIERITGAARQANDRVVVAPTYADLPSDLREKAKQTGHDIRGIRGVFHNNQVYIVRENIQSQRELEEVLFHEGTHGGLRDLLQDRSVVKSLNKLYAALGGREGFDKAVRDLNLEDDLAPYFEAYSNSEADLNLQIRNARLVEEMIAFTGQKDSKGIKLRIQELVGAIRNWFRERGYLKLAKATASDIAFIAKKARQQYFTSMSAGEGTAYSVRDTGPRAQKTDQGLFSNAEQILLEQGDKIFKPSKKNPEGAVRGDQILSFLKGRGIKKDELAYTQLEEFLVFDGAPKRTKQEVIEYLRRMAPDFREEVGVGFGTEDETGIAWSENQIMDEPQYYEHLVEDYSYEASKNNWDDERAMDTLRILWKEHRAAMESMALARFPNDKKRLAEYGIQKDTLLRKTTSPLRADEFAQMYDELGEELWDDIQENFEYEWDEAAEAAAREEYLNSPVVRTETYIDSSDTEVFIEGNDDYGYAIWVNGSNISEREAIWTIDEAKIQAQGYLIDYGLNVDTTGTLMFGYFSDLNQEKPYIYQYREIKQVIQDNEMGGGQEFYSTHWNDLADVLYASITTDRLFGPVNQEGGINGETLVIEEVQSDWHTAIRKGGNQTYDIDEITRVQDEELPPLRQEYQDAQDVRNAARSDLYKAVFEKVFPNDVGIGDEYQNDKKARIEQFVSETMLKVAEFERDVVPYLSPTGLDRLRRLRDKYGVSLRKNFSVSNGQSDITEDGLLKGFLEELGDFAEPFRLGGMGSSANPTQSYWKPEVLRNGDERLRIRRQAEMDKKKTGSADLVRQIQYERDVALEKIGNGPYEIFQNAKGSQRYNALAYMAVEKAHGNQFNDLAAAYLESQANADKAEYRYGNKRSEVQRLESAPPDSPFRDDRYLEVAAKRAIIRAIEEGKGGVAISKADRVQERWADRYDYEALYNRKLKKVFDKILKTEGMSLDTEGEVDVITNTGFWAWPLTQEMHDQIEYEGLPMYSAKPDAGRIYVKRDSETKVADKFIQRLQDKFLPLKRLQQAIEETGGVVFEEADVHLAEEMFYGKTEEDLRQIELLLVEPLVNEMESLGISVKELDDFLMAKHAPERNREIARINPEMPDGGSGLSTAEAEAHIAGLDAQKKANLEKVAGRVYEMTQLTRDLLVNGGLVSEAEISSWNDKYEFYVPLKGFAEGEKKSDGTAIRTGRGYEIGGKESRRALGRRSRAASPLAQVISDLTEKTIRNRKNEVGQSFLALATSNPDPMYWQVFTAENPDMEDRYNAKAGKVVKGPVDMARDPRYFGVKKDGKEYFIKVKDERVLNALRKVGPQGQNVLVNIMGAATRWLSFVNTAANPEFVILNFARDIQAAGLNILAEQSKEGGRIEGESIAKRATSPRSVGKAIKAIANYHRNKKTGPDDSEYQQYYQEFLDTGAKTGFFDTPELDKIAKDLNQKMKDAGSGRTVKKGLNAIVDFITDYNTAVENGIRLSSYIEARKAGLSAKKAGSFAKNLTVNFNRKGEYGQVLNSAYMFFNAAVQGTAQWAATMSPFQVDSQGKWSRRRKLNVAQKVAGGMVVSAAMLANLNRMIGGEDDDGEAFWDKIPPAIRERNIIFMKPDGSGDYYTLPLPYGYNFFYNLGDAFEGMAFGSDRRKPKLLSGVLESFITAFSPVALHAADGLGERLFLSGTPTIAAPAAELVTNTNFFGEDIVRENFPNGPERADAHNYWATTKGPYVAIAKFMNDTIGGGSEYKSGSVDPLGFFFDTPVLEVSTDFSPDALEHLLEFSLGGIYRTGVGAFNSAQRYFNDREVPASTIPFARALIKQDRSDFADQESYYQTRQLILNADKEYRDSSGDERRKAVRKHNGLHLLYRDTLRVDRVLRDLREDRDAVRDNKNLTPRERDSRLEAIQADMDTEIDRFSVRYQRHLAQRAKGG